jgi:hypothetical protein
MDKEALKKKTVAELKDMAKEIPDVKGISAMKKDDLVELLAGRAGSKDEPAKTPPAKAPQAQAAMATEPLGKTPKAKANIKERIRALKAEKREALDQHDRKKTRRCNRQIHHFKRRLRKMAKEAK